MSSKTRNAWAMEPAPAEEGYVFSCGCHWQSMPMDQISDTLSNHAFKGMYEDNGSVIMILMFVGSYKLLKISAGEEGKVVANIMDIPADGYRLIMDRLCHDD